MIAVALLWAAWLAAGAGQKTAAKPAFAGESLAYTINWPSGLSLGEARLHADYTAKGWSFAFSLDAAVPGFAISDSYLSAGTADFCSTEFIKQFTHGRKKVEERTSFDAAARTATRVTLRPEYGGKSTFPVPACAHDALEFLFFLRRELAEGRMPPPQTIYFGAPYQVRLEYAGSQSVRLGGRTWKVDRVRASLKGPASDTSFDLLLAHDAARTPLIVRAPFALGTFSMELVP